MQRFLTSDAKYAYSPRHDRSAQWSLARHSKSSVSRDSEINFPSADDFTPERYAVAETLKWAVTGPIDVAGAEAGGAVAVTIHSVEPSTPGVVVYGSYTAEEPYEWWDEETACDVYDVSDGSSSSTSGRRLRPVRLSDASRRGPHVTSCTRACRARYGGNLDCKEIRPGATIVLPVEHEGAGLYFGDCKALMGDGEIVGPPEIGALVVATAEPRPRPSAMTWPRIETSDSFTTLVSGKPLEWSARQAYRELLEWIVEDYEIARPKAALLMAMVADAGICQISNDDYTALLRRSP